MPRSGIVAVGSHGSFIFSFIKKLFVLIVRVSRDHSLVVVHRLQIAVVLVAEHGEFYAYGLRSCTRV